MSSPVQTDCERAMSRRRRAKPRTPRTMTRLNVGRTFADRDVLGRWYVVLVVDGVWSLVWWEDGTPREIPTSQVKRRKLRLESWDFPVSQLPCRWGITLAVLDEFLEHRMYKWDKDVREVRAKRTPLNGRTVVHVRHRHRSHRVGGG